MVFDDKNDKKEKEEVKSEFGKSIGDTKEWLSHSRRMFMKLAFVSQIFLYV